MRRFFYATSSDSSDKNTPTYPQLSTLTIGAHVELTESIVHHWCRVLRANIGDKGILFDGFGGEYQVQLTAISKKNATVSVLAYQRADNTAPIISKVALVMSRGERMDYAIQKATELGVTAIQLLSSQHGEVNLKPAQVEKKLAHWQQIAIAACEQCGLNRPPLIFAPLPITTWLQQSQPLPLVSRVSPIVAALSRDPYYYVLDTPADLRLVLSVPAENLPAMPTRLTQVMATQSPFIELLIGSEGGLSSEEITHAIQSGFEPWQIGKRILRTETAPVVALATLHALSI